MAMKMSDLRSMDADDILRNIGLQTRRSRASSVLTVAGLVGAGIVVGIGLGMMFAPQRGDQIRREMRAKAGEVKARAGHYKDKLAREAEEAKERITSSGPQVS
jgi:gas vesicle protein